MQDDPWKCMYCDGPIARSKLAPDRAVPGTRFCATCLDSMRMYAHQDRVRQQRLKEVVRRRGEPIPAWEDDEPISLQSHPL